VHSISTVLCKSPLAYSQQDFCFNIPKLPSFDEKHNAPTHVEIFPFLVLLSRMFSRGTREIFIFWENTVSYEVHFECLLVLCPLLIAAFLYICTQQTMFSHVARATRLKLPCWHKIVKCGFIIHLIMRKTNTGWHAFVFSPLRISLFTTVSQMSLYLTSKNE
jgi:hypothetical protein